MYPTTVNPTMARVAEGSEYPCHSPTVVTSYGRGRAYTSSIQTPTTSRTSTAARNVNRWRQRRKSSIAPMSTAAATNMVQPVTTRSTARIHR